MLRFNNYCVVFVQSEVKSIYTKYEVQLNFLLIWDKKQFLALLMPWIWAIVALPFFCRYVDVGFQNRQIMGLEFTAFLQFILVLFSKVIIIYQDVLLHTNAYSDQQQKLHSNLKYQPETLGFFS